jgi:hypothetical protein
MWSVALLLFSVAPIKFLQEREWSEVVARLHYISLCIGVIIGFAANFLQTRQDKAIMKPNDWRILTDISPYGAMWAPGFLPLCHFNIALYSVVTRPGLPQRSPSFPLLSESSSYSSGYTSPGQCLMRNTLSGVAPFFGTQLF